MEADAAQTLLFEDWSGLRVGPLPAENTAAGEYHYHPPAGESGQWHNPMAGVGLGHAPWLVIEDNGRHLLLQTSTGEANRWGIARLVAGIDNPKIAVLGLAFKGNVDDMRESPSLKVIELLEDQGMRVAVHDPYVKKSPMELSGIEDCFRDADCVVLLTDHSDYKYLNPVELKTLVRTACLFDTRNLLQHDAWRAAGFRVNVLGAGPERPRKARTV